MAMELLRDLDVEAVAVREGDAELLRAADHGSRLVELRNVVKGQVPGERTALDYRFDQMHLTVVRLGGQTGALLGVEARGTMASVTYDDTGRAVGRESDGDASPFANVFVLRPGDDGRWLLILVRPLE